MKIMFDMIYHHKSGRLLHAFLQATHFGQYLERKYVWFN